MHFAGGYAGFLAVLSIVFGQPILETLLYGAILFGYTAFVYMIVDRYGDRIFAPLGVLAAGGIILVASTFYF